MSLSPRAYIAQLVLRAVAAGAFLVFWQSPWALLPAWAITWGIEVIVPLGVRQRDDAPCVEPTWYPPTPAKPICRHGRVPCSRCRAQGPS